MKMTLTAAILLALISTASAASTRDTICQDGVFNAGVKSDSAPFGFIDENGTQTGFDVDIVKEITKDLSAYCKKPVRLVLKTVTGSNRIPFVQNGTVDLAAATATITYARLDVVDFSNPYFVDGVRILVPAGSDVKTLRDLNGKAVGTVQGTTGENIVKTQGKGAKVTSFQQYTDAFTALQQGRIQAIVTDSTILLGLKVGSSDPKKWSIVGPFLSQEPYGLIMRQDQATWRNFVNESLSRMATDGTYRKITTKWFGSASKYDLPGLKAAMTVPAVFPVRR